MQFENPFPDLWLGGALYLTPSRDKGRVQKPQLRKMSVIGGVPPFSIIVLPFGQSLFVRGGGTPLFHYEKIC